jgi:hypothetical protein
MRAEVDVEMWLGREMARLAEVRRRLDNVWTLSVVGLSLEQLEALRMERLKLDGELAAVVHSVLHAYGGLLEHIERTHREDEREPKPNCRHCGGTGTAYDPGDPSVGYPASHIDCPCLEE